MDTLRQELLGELAKITSPLGFRIVELNAMRGKRGYTITAVVDKGGAVTLEDCERITNLFNARLEVLELLRGANWSLQVSSPGTSRVLKSREEYDIFRGREVRVVLKEPVEIPKVMGEKVEGAYGETADARGAGVSRTNVVDGMLVDVEGDSITLSISGEKLTIPFANISKTRLHE
jgi:ribosome maturation factor RimP